MTGIVTIPSKSFDQMKSQFLSYTSGAFYETKLSGEIGYTLNNSFPGIFTLTSYDVLTVTYYDNYDFTGKMDFDGNNNISGYSDSEGDSRYYDRVLGQVTGSRTRIISDGNWLISTNYYDNHDKVIQSRRNLYDGLDGYETISNLLDFQGKMLQTLQLQKFNGSLMKVYTFNTYDHSGRLIKTEHQIGDNATARVTLSEMIYNELGQLTEKKLHGGLQNLKYTYNIRGWLTGINDPDQLGTKLFGMQLLYNNIIPELNAATDALYNGNISAIKWRTDNAGTVKAYGYSYDGLDRILKANYGEQSSNWNNTQFDEGGGADSKPVIQYDLNGNILTMGRRAADRNWLDQLDYRYDGNVLMALGTAGSSAPSTNTYHYDLNGNMDIDQTKNLSVTYNHLNKPQRVEFANGNYIDYLYDASGNKLSKDVYSSGSLTSYTYYAGNIVYKNGSFDYIITSEGRVTKPSGSYVYEYNLKDHLGNTRVSFQANANGTITVNQRADYYAFGKRFAGYANNDNKYLYNGKELQDEFGLDLYDYGFRYYNPELGRFVSVDPLANDYPQLTPYQYTSNNPVKNIDLDGLEGISPPSIATQQLMDSYKSNPNSYIKMTVGGIAIGLTGGFALSEIGLWSGIGGWSGFTSLPAINTYITSAFTASYGSRLIGFGADATGQFVANSISNKSLSKGISSINWSVPLYNLWNPTTSFFNGIIGNSFQVSAENGFQLGTPSQIIAGSFTEWAGGAIGGKMMDSWFGSSFYKNELNKIYRYNSIGTNAAITAGERQALILTGFTSGIGTLSESFENITGNYLQNTPIFKEFDDVMQQTSSMLLNFEFQW